MRRILMSVNLNPSFSTLARIRGTFFSRSLFIRMCPPGGDQIVGQAFATSIVEVPRNFERRKWFGPISIGLGRQGARRADDRNKCPQEDDPQTEPVLLYVVQLQIVCYE